jgi:predicted phosphodiesterase
MDPRASQKLRRIGIIGDIHCEDQLLETTLRFLQSQQVELICAVGDIVDGPGNANRAIELLVQHHVVCVRGNHERWLFAGEMRGLPDANSRFDLNGDSWDFLPELRTMRGLATVAGQALLCHGLGEDDMAGVWPDDPEEVLQNNIPLKRLVASHQYEFVINGHTHYRMVRSFEHLTIINAGTLFRKHNPGFGLVEFDTGIVRFFDVGFNGSVLESEIVSLPISPEAF